MRRIEFLETLGRGGFGAVYLADVHGRDDFVQRLAVKVLSADMNEHADVAARQRDEARLLARLNHDHIVRVVDLTEVDGRPAVLMEYVEGADCAVLLKRGPLPPRAAVQVAMASASALDAAWSTVGRSGRPLRVIHRDIKPANLLVSRHGGVKVLDFGVARADFDREGQTGSVQFGTARFMAPEQWLYGEASHKVDVYALGVSLVEMLSGLHLQRAPLDEAAFRAHMASVRTAVVQPEWPSTFREGIDGLLGLMLAFEPDLRPDAGDCFEILAELADRAPGTDLRRWAAQEVPPAVAAQKERWAAEPPPGALSLPDAPVPVQLEETASAGLPTDSGQRTTVPVVGPPTAPGAEPADTLATQRPGLRPASRMVPLVAALASLAVLGGGLAAVLPGLLAGDEPVQAGPAEPSTPSEAAVQSPPATVEQAAVDRLAVEEAAAVEPGVVDPTVGQPTVGQPAQPEATAQEPAAAKTAAAKTAAAKTAAVAPPEAKPEPAQAPQDQPAALPSQQDSPPDPTPEQPAAATVPVSVSSTPWGAELRVDGQLVGHTPQRDLPLTAGAHHLTLTLGEHSTTHSITVGGRNPTQHSWTVETNEWRSSL